MQTATMIYKTKLLANYAKLRLNDWHGDITASTDKLEMADRNTARSDPDAPSGAPDI